MANRRVSPRHKARPIGVSLPHEVIRQAQKLAFSRGISFSALVRQLVQRELEGAA